MRSSNQALVAMRSRLPWLKSVRKNPGAPFNSADLWGNLSQSGHTTRSCIGTRRSTRPGTLRCGLNEPHGVLTLPCRIRALEDELRQRHLAITV
jgi:hypothetical protein